MRRIITTAISARLLRESGRHAKALRRQPKAPPPAGRLRSISSLSDKNLAYLEQRLANTKAKPSVLSVSFGHDQAGQPPTVDQARGAAKGEPHIPTHGAIRKVLRQPQVPRKSPLETGRTRKNLEKNAQKRPNTPQQEISPNPLVLLPQALPANQPSLKHAQTRKNTPKHDHKNHP